MNIFDAHCDVLYKMWLNPTIVFEDAKELHITGKQLKQTGAKVQCFAIYIPESVSFEGRFDVALEMIDIFYTNVIQPSNVFKHVRTRHDIENLKENEIGAVLTLEGCDPVGNSITRFKTLLRLGITSVGLTWNYANAVADGILEARGAGLSTFGREIVKEANRAHIWTDVSHLSIRGFWDVIEKAKYPIASHSNSFSICNHPRNLNDEQIKALIVNDGMIGVTFVPQFLTNKKTASITDILKHVDYICSLGGENNLGFGSDFDGIDETVNGLSNFSNYETLINELLKHYSDTLVKRFLFQNFVEHMPN